MNDCENSIAPATLASVGRDAGFLAHELRNILTVYFGLVEELQVHEDTEVQQASQLLAAASAKTQDIAQQIFALRERALSENSVDPSSVLQEIIADCPGLNPLADSLAELPKLWGNATAFRSLLVQLDKYCSPLGAVTVEPIPGAHPGAGFRLRIRTPVSISDRHASFLSESAQALGGECQRSDGDELLLDLRA